MIYKPSRFYQFIKIILAVVVVLAVVAAIYLAVRGQRKVIKSGELNNYTIPNVPYIGLYNHKGQYNPLGYDKSSVTAMLLEYWNPGKNDFRQVFRSFYLLGRGNFLGLSNIADAVGELGDYSTKTEHLETSELKKYINSQARTPLLLFLPIDGNQPEEIIYRPLMLLIGQDEKGEKLAFHDYWLGNNVEMSYDEFNRRMSRMRPEERNNYLIIQPKDIEGALGRITEEPTTAYTKRTDAMNKMGVMIKNYVMGYGASLMRQDEQMIKFLSQVEKSPDFEAFLPPSLKVGSYYLLGRAYFLQKNYDMALEYAGKAIELDHDLDKPSGDWPGYEYSANLPTKYGIDSRPFELAGDAFLGKDMPAEAKKYYYKALAIYPKNAGLKEKITLTQKKQ